MPTITLTTTQAFQDDLVILAEGEEGADDDAKVKNYVSKCLEEDVSTLRRTKAMREATFTDVTDADIT